MNNKVDDIVERTIKNIEDDIEQIHLEILGTPINAKRLVRIGELGDSLAYARNEIKELEGLRNA